MSRPSKISVLDCLSFMYYCAMVHDGEITESELNVLIDKVLEWVPNDKAAAGPSISGAQDWWIASNKQGGIEAIAVEFVYCSRIVKENVEDAAKRAILGDLAAIFEADGKVTKGEQALYTLLEKDLFS